MAISITITNGTETVTLTSTDAELRSYVEQTPESGAPSVIETIEANLIGGNSAVDATIAKLGILFQMNRARLSGTNGNAYTYLVITLDSAVWRSRILEGRVITAQDSWLKYEWALGSRRASIIVQREPCWEANAETQVPLTNGTATGNTSGLVVMNHDDSGSGHDNWADIAAGVILGDLPANCRLEMVNSTSASPTAAQLIWVGLNRTNLSFNHVLEAESATGETPSSGAIESNGQYVSKTISTTDETDLLTWAISGANLSTARGMFVKTLARFSSIPDTSIRYRWRMQWGGYTLWEGPLVSLDTNIGSVIQDLGDFRLPPWLQGMDHIDGINLILRVMLPVQPKTIALDFVHLMPADGSRRYFIQGSLPQNNRLVDDGINQMVYQDNGAGALRIGGISISGASVQLLPGLAQRLYFLQHSNSLGDAKIARTLTVKLFYRPRRSTL